MSTYSFLDVNAALSGVGGSIILGNGSGAAEEGITIAMVDDKSSMTIGADGQGMHSLSGSKAATVTCRFLKTSPVNAALMAMYNLQTSSSVLHGKNTIVVTDFGRGDTITLTGVAFKKAPDINYAKDGGTHEWTFDAINVVHVLGIGVPEV